MPGAAAPRQETAKKLKPFGSAGFLSFCCQTAFVFPAFSAMPAFPEKSLLHPAGQPAARDAPFPLIDTAP
jgi:hypothetical protein